VHHQVPERIAAAETARLGKLLTRAQKQEISPFVLECATPFDLPALHAALLESGDRVGLLACGDLAAALRVVLGGGAVEAARVRAQPAAVRLIQFALSAEHADLVRALEES
jgi:hypothetical protein